MLKYILPLFVSVTCVAQSINEDHQLLWEISGKGLKEKSYLFGSLHSNDKELFHLSDSTYYALDQAKMIVLEADIFSLFDELDTRSSHVSMNYDNEGNPYGSSLESSETMYGNEDGMPQFLDAYFQQYCYNAGKQFEELETVEFQVDVMYELGTLNHDYYRYTSNSELIDIYLRGDIYTIDEYLRSNLSVYSKGYNRLIVERNFGMSTKLDSLLQGNKTSLFCAVGAGHLAGSSGLINLLRSKGYNVRKVMASYSENQTESEKNVRAKKNYTFQDDENHLRVTFPGKPIVIKDEEEGFELKLVYRDLGQGNTYIVELYELSDELDLEEIARTYVGSPAESPVKRIELEHGGAAYQGIADNYTDGLYWVRIVTSEDHFAIIKAFGGNKFMNSKRAHKFFDGVWVD